MKRTCPWSILTVLCILTLFLSHAGIVGAEEPAKKKEAKPENAALVNGQPIPYKDFEMQADAQQQRMGTSGKSVSQIRDETLDMMISTELLYQQSVKSGIKVDQKKVEDQFTAFKQRFNDQKKYDDWLAKVNLTEDQLKAQFLQNMSVRELITKEIEPNVKITDKQIEAFYNENPQYFEKAESVRARHILIKVEKGADEKQKKEAHQKLVDIKKRLDKGEKFEELAKAHSQCPSSSQGGDLGFFTKGRMVPAFEKVAFELKPGQVSDIVETQFGYHLIEVVERKEPGKVELGEVKERISEELRKKESMEQIQKYIDGLRKTAKIEKFVETSDAAAK